MLSRIQPRREVRHRLAVAQAALCAMLLAACDRPAPAPTPEPTVDGAGLYEQSCAMCHFDGRDSQAAPALVQSPVVTSDDPAALIRVIVHGQRDVSVVDGKLFGGIMPATQGLTDTEVAAIATYVRQHYGGPPTPVTAAQVAAGR